MFKPKLLNTIKTYDKKQFFTDSMSGVIVGIVAIPLAIAFGIASGVGPAEGLVTAIIAGFIISFLGGSKVQIGGPTGAFIVIVYGIIQKYGIGGLMISTIMAGIMLMFMGFFKLGTIIKFVPYPVIAGFTGGIAVVIFSTQINDLFGMNLKNIPNNFIDKWIFYANNMQNIDLLSFALAVFGILLIISAARVSNKIPGALLAILILTPTVYFLKNYGLAENVKTIGDSFTLPQGLPVFKLPEFSIPAEMTFVEYIRVLLSPAFTIAMLGAIESLLSAMVADGAIGDNHDSNTELIAQGAANVITPFFGGIPATGAIARTMTNINNGGRSPVAGMIHAIFLLLVMLVFGQLIGYIPMPCLAAILLVVAYNMSGWRTMVAMRNHPRSDFAVLLITFFLTVIFDLTIAIEVGLLLAIVLFLRRTNENTAIRSFHKEIDPSDNAVSDSNIKLEIPEKVEIYEIDGPYFFGIANKFDDMMRITANKHFVRIINMKKVPFMDSTGIKNFEILCERIKKEKITIIICGANTNVLKILVKSGIAKIIGEKNFCIHLDTAIEKAKEIVEIEEKNILERKTINMKIVGN
jgi:SulP family sulfate permease